MMSESRMTWMIIFIIIAIIVVVLMFRNYYKTEEERNLHRNKLVCWIIVAIIAVVVVSYMSESGTDQEYGIRSSARDWWRTKREQREAGQDARREAERAVKQRQRAEKGQSVHDEALGRAQREGVRK